MTIKYNAGNLKPTNGGYSLINPGLYKVRIIKAIPKESKKGHPMVTVDFQVIEGQGADGKEIKFHNVTFLPPYDDKGEPSKGAGMALHFLKCIKQPYEGEFDINVDDWYSKELIAKVGVGRTLPSEKYPEGLEVNTILQVYPLEDKGGNVANSNEILDDSIPPF